MIRRPTRSTRTDARFPYATLFRSGERDVPQRLVEERGVVGGDVVQPVGAVRRVDPDGPWQVAGPAEQLLVEPVAETADGLRDGDGRCDDVEQDGDVETSAAGEDDSGDHPDEERSEEHTSELQSLMRI